jgi:hypothetical protein
MSGARRKTQTGVQMGMTAISAVSIRKSMVEAAVGEKLTCGFLSSPLDPLQQFLEA